MPGDPVDPAVGSVIRIPVAGPKPFNTLVVVRANVSHGPGTWASDGNVYRPPVIFDTPFRLIGYDPRVDVPYEHSTTAVIYQIQLTDDTNFLAAFDAVHGSFNDLGQWIVTINSALASDGEWMVYLAHVSSWILCHEPPPPAQDDQRLRKLSPGLARRLGQQPSESGSQPIGRRRPRRSRKLFDLAPCRGSATGASAETHLKPWGLRRPRREVGAGR